MRSTDIPLGEAEILSALLEGVLYGFSLLMFGGTIWALVSRRSTYCVNRKMITVACLLLLLSTAHFVLNIIRIMQAFILWQHSHTGGAIQYFSDMSQWTSVCMNYLFTAQMLLGNGVVLYRCYVAWQSKLVIILPLVFWCAIGATGIGSTYTASRARDDEIFTGYLLQWIVSFVASSLATNLLTTSLLACRIWYVDRKARRMYGPGKSQLRPMLYIIIDAGLIYSFALIAGLVCFLCQSNLQYVLLYMIPPIISITFYMVIIRAGLANRAEGHSRFTSVDKGRDGRLRMQVHITTFTESKVENGRIFSMAPIDSESHESVDKHHSMWVGPV